ncbi:MAG TPA: hypothetical protein PKA82_11810 [Pyrinomonadaceae bacterium]|nr:hypothetical protein [Pyrinomonadaceae bacterium]
MNNWAEIIFVLGVLIGSTTVILHIVFAIAVYIDSQRLVHDDKQEVALVPGTIWAIATLIGGVLVAIGYWIVNRSKIANRSVKAKDFDISEYLS